MGRGTAKHFVGYRTIPQKVTNEMPYALAFGLEAVIPLEVGLPTI